MEKLTEGFVNGLSIKSQDLIKNKLFFKNVIEKFLINHGSKHFINELGGLQEASENRFIGELNFSEIELMVIQEFLLEQIKKQKEILRVSGLNIASMMELGFRTSEINNAEKEQIEEKNRLSTLFKEHDKTANYVNCLIEQRLKKEIVAILDKDSDLEKFMFRYNAYRLSDWPGFIFRIYDKNKIILDNHCAMGGD